MARLALAVALIPLLLTAVLAQDRLLPALHTDTNPTVDGVLGADEWETPAVEGLSSVDVPPSVITAGSFSGASDLRLEIRALYAEDRLFLAVRVFDDAPRDADALRVDLGAAMLTVRGDGTSDGPAGDWTAAVVREVDGFTFEIGVASALVAPISLPGALLSFGLGFEDDDTGDDSPEGVLSRSEIGAGILYTASPRGDLLGAAALLVALADDPDRGDSLVKQSEKLLKAAREEDWPDAFAPDPDVAKKVLDRIRSVARKLEKIQRKEEGEALADLLDAPLTRLDRAARFATAKLVRRAIAEAGRAEAQSALERQATAEASMESVETRIKLFRKSAKKAAKLL